MYTATVTPPKKQRELKRVIYNPAFDDTVTFLQTARESKARITDLEVRLGPGGKNSLHTHRSYTETFTPIKGTLELRVGRKRILLNPGESFTIPIGTPHYFANPGKEEICFNTAIKPGHEGFENSLRILYGLAVDGITKINSWDAMLKVSVILKLSDMRLCGIHSLMNPVVDYWYKLAKKKGIEKELIDKYVI